MSILTNGLTARAIPFMPYVLGALAFSLGLNVLLVWWHWHSAVKAGVTAQLCSTVNEGNGETVKTLQNRLDACLFDKARTDADLRDAKDEHDTLLAKAIAQAKKRTEDIRHDPDCASWAAAPVCPAAAGVRPDHR